MPASHMALSLLIHTFFRQQGDIHQPMLAQFHGGEIAFVYPAVNDTDIDPDQVRELTFFHDRNVYLTGYIPWCFHTVVPQFIAIMTCE